MNDTKYYKYSQGNWSLVKKKQPSFTGKSSNKYYKPAISICVSN